MSIWPWVIKSRTGVRWRRQREPGSVLQLWKSWATKMPSGKTEVHLALFFGSDRDAFVHGGKKYMKRGTGWRVHPLRATGKQTYRQGPVGPPVSPSVPTLASPLFHLPELFYSVLFSMSCYRSLGLFLVGIFGFCFILLKKVWEFVCSNKLELWLGNGLILLPIKIIDMKYPTASWERVK